MSTFFFQCYKLITLYTHCYVLLLTVHTTSYFETGSDILILLELFAFLERLRFTSFLLPQDIGGERKNGGMDGGEGKKHRYCRYIHRI